MEARDDPYLMGLRQHYDVYAHAQCGTVDFYLLEFIRTQPCQCHYTVYVAEVFIISTGSKNEADLDRHMKRQEFGSYIQCTCQSTTRANYMCT